MGRLEVFVVSGLVASILLPAFAGQVPLPDNHYVSNKEWSFDEFPDPDATDHLVFDSVYSLLQHWPNTRMRNGHNVVPGIIPKGTIVYHATGEKDQTLPQGPEWVAMDPEHAYFFCRGYPLGSQECWQLAFSVTRPLKVIYFDGSSAAKIPYGTLDTQDLFVWGNSPDMLDDEGRAEGLCAWGKKVGVDGFVRMEMSFEIILCNFTSGLRTFSSSGLVLPWDTDFVSKQAMQESIYAGTWHNRFPGETRIKLDLAELVSFYDTKLVPSLVAVRAGQERWQHRALNASDEDVLAVFSKLEAAMLRPSKQSSGIDWQAILHVVVDRFSGRLELMRHLLNSSVTTPDGILDPANKMQTQLRVTLAPYILFSATPTDPSDETDLEWSIPIFKLCGTTLTGFMDSYIDAMTDSEKLILQAVRGVNREICRVVTKMWALGVYAGIDPSLNTKESPDVNEVTRVWTSWEKELSRLMAWLDWSAWVKCNPVCNPEEMCYISTWPIDYPCMPHETECKNPPMPTERSWNTTISKWFWPEPKCVRRFAPFDFKLGETSIEGI